MANEAQPTPKRSRRWQWLLILVFVAISFACVFCSTQIALFGEPDRVIAANMLPYSQADYQVEDDDQVEFAPLDPRIILEATRDTNDLRVTFSLPSASSTPPVIERLPSTPTSKPIQVENTPTNTVVATETRPVFTNTPVTATRIPVPPTNTTSPPPTNTPVPPTTTLSPPTNTPVPPTKTPVPPSKTPVLPTRTPKPPKPTDTPVPPTETSLVQTSTSTQTQTSTPSFTSTGTNTPTSTATPTGVSSPSPTSTSTATSTPSQTSTGTATPTSTSSPTPTWTGTATPTFTPSPTSTLVRISIIPHVTCQTNNGDGTVTVYFGYDNQNSFSVDIPIGPDNFFIPNPMDRGQPTSFTPGYQDISFSVTFNEALVGLIWILDGNFTLAWTGSPACP